MTRDFRVVKETWIGAVENADQAVHFLIAGRSELYFAEINYVLLLCLKTKGLGKSHLKQAVLCSTLPFSKPVKLPEIELQRLSSQFKTWGIAGNYVYFLIRNKRQFLDDRPNNIVDS